uniref:Uncharacterized protein n=1 Tax=Aureimonas frigidaquae TaxID=424757 RepID=A0A0P0Z0N4_9HYPH|nr:hypothetical protein [Aureimonas frigidaquae]
MTARTHGQNPIAGPGIPRPPIGRAIAMQDDVYIDQSLGLMIFPHGIMPARRFIAVAW